MPILRPNESVTLSIISGDKLACFSRGVYKVTQTNIGYPNLPATKSLLNNASGAYTSAAFSAASTVVLQAPARVALFYNTGTAPTVPESSNQEANQGAPGTLNATGTLTAALMQNLIVTSSTAAAVTATVDTGTAMDLAIDSIAIGDSFDWSAINTGASNAFTVTAASGHTLVGSGVVALSTSGRFRSRRTAANTWITYRLS